MTAPALRNEAIDPAVIDALRSAPPRHVIDLIGRLGEELEAATGYQGIGW